MRIQIPPDKVALIKESFEKMLSSEDLLNLLNMVASIQEGWYQPGKILAEVSFSELLENPGTSLSELFAQNRKQLITQKQLLFFSSSFEGKDKKRSRYVRFHIPKKNGTLREIKSPLPKLKEIQRAINTILQLIFTVQEQAYGFVPGRNIADNARLHAGTNFVLNIDIKDFFPSVHFRRIKLMLEKPPFNLTAEREPLAFLIANLCTEEGVLPQGAPTSPTLTNIICQRLDRRLQQLATQYKAVYTRYADDITFSCNEYIFTRRFMERLEKILKDDRFEINPEKTRIQGKAFRQEVTGLTVNEKVNVSRKFFRSYRTLLHIYKKKGAEKALEYYRRRMPASVAAIKFKKEIKDPDIYMQNVIWGKYYFMIMVKGKENVKPPFEIITNTLKLEDEFTKLPGTQYKRVVKNNESKLLSPAEEEQPQAKNLIEEILAIWESDPKGDGFEKSMELLKKQLNEH